MTTTTITNHKDTNTVNNTNMKQARKQYRSQFSHVTERRDKDGKLLERARVWAPNAPGFRVWVRTPAATARNPIGKLAQILSR